MHPGPGSEAVAAETKTRRRSEDADDPGRDDTTPFEWLTSFGSLRHLVLPSRILAGSARADAAAATARPALRLDALHVGCGTSAAGEALLRLREHTGTRLLQYGRVTNVDNDRQALDRMQKRWERGRSQRADEHAAAQSDEMGSMEWKYLDFKREETCRSALDGAAEADAPEGGFDLVLDKATLDCLLCAETCVAAQYFHEVYRALRVPAASERNAHENAEAGSSARGGGVYVLVTFHPVEFVERLLTRLPGAEWQVEHEVLERELEDLKEDGGWAMDEIASQANDGAAAVGAMKDVCSPSPSAWASGTFSPADACHKTVTVFTCRRCRTETKGDAPSPVPRGLDREQVRKHIEKTCDTWYQQTNPMVTSEREHQLRSTFSEAARAATRGGPGEGKSAHEDTVLDLQRCYELMFTEAERDHLAYEYFLEDWGAYCELAGKMDALRSPEGMTVSVALDFLKEMQ